MTTLRVLLVEDDHLLARAVQRLLQPHDVDLRRASDGQTALDMLRADRTWEPDVVLSDFDMPRMTGADLYQHLADEAPHLARRVVIMSGRTASEDFCARHSLPLLAKPWLPTEVVAAIAAVVGERISSIRP